MNIAEGGGQETIKRRGWVSGRGGEAQVSMKFIPSLPPSSVDVCKADGPIAASRLTASLHTMGQIEQTDSNGRGRLMD